MRRPGFQTLMLLSRISLAAFTLVWVLIEAGVTRGLDTALMQAALRWEDGPLKLFAQTGNVLGYTISLLPVAAAGSIAIYQLGRRVDAPLPFVVLAVARLANTAIKCAVARPRPETEADLTMMTQCDRFSFPSGHTMDSTAVYGLLAIWVIGSFPDRRGRIVGTILALMPIAIGLSRVALGVHWISDVAGGWLASALIVFATLLLWQRLTPERRPGQ